MAFLLISLELVFRFLLPAAEMPLGHQDPQWNIMALSQESAPKGRHSIGRLCRPAFQWKINNYGFNSAYDFSVPGDRQLPCGVVIGNSYVQGLYSDVEKHLAGCLQTDFAGEIEFYNLGTSGMPLSQTPRVIAFAEQEFEPDIIIIQAGLGSLKRSLGNNGRVPYSQQYLLEEGHFKVLAPSRLRVNRTKRLLGKSAVVRYLFYNANINLGGGGDVVQAAQEGGREAAVPLGDTQTRTYSSLLDTIFSDINELTTAPVLVVFDADRKSMYADNIKPRRIWESLLVEEACSRNGAFFLDLTEAFWDEYQTKGELLNFDDNYHWNPNGVKVVSVAIGQELKESGVLEGLQPPVSP